MKYQSNWDDAGSQQGVRKNINNWSLPFAFRNTHKMAALWNVAQTTTRNLGDRANELAKFVINYLKFNPKLSRYCKEGWAERSCWETDAEGIWKQQIRENKFVYSCNEFRSNAEGICPWYKQWDDNRAGLALITFTTKGGTSKYGISVTINMT